MNNGLIHVYYGDGKGKTTAALGLALRASGCGKQVVMIQFLKDSPSGELSQLERLPSVTVIRGKAGTMFVRDMSPQDKDATREKHNENLRAALARVEDGQCDLLILDEGLDACQLELLDGPLLSELITRKPPGLELVITGHYPIGWILEKADYITEMVKRRHPYDRGIGARKGIEF